MRVLRTNDEGNYQREAPDELAAGFSPLNERHAGCREPAQQRFSIPAAACCTPQPWSPHFLSHACRRERGAISLMFDNV